MGSKTKKITPTIDDALIEIKINSKRLKRESQKAQKDSTAYLKKAKEALKKNKEEGAKLYLQSASSKRIQAMSLQKMSMKMEFIASNLKSMEGNQKIMNSLQRVANFVNMNSPNFEAMSNNLNNLERCMDEILINGKMMEQLMSKDTQTDQNVNDMFNALRGELAMETANQVNQAAIIQQKETKFQDDLKKL